MDRFLTAFGDELIKLGKVRTMISGKEVAPRDRTMRPPKYPHLKLTGAQPHGALSFDRPVRPMPGASDRPAKSVVKRRVKQRTGYRRIKAPGGAFIIKDPKGTDPAGRARKKGEVVTATVGRARLEPAKPKKHGVRIGTATGVGRKPAPATTRPAAQSPAELAKTLQRGRPKVTPIKPTTVQPTAPTPTAGG